jgi:hypothetical protein
MAAAVDDPPRDLSATDCRELLLGSAHGFLGCTSLALPLVVPAEIECVDGQVLVLVHDRRLCGPLSGHVVALTVGGRERAPLRGWTVVACGRVGLPLADRPGQLVLEIRTLRGWTYDGSPAAARAPELAGPPGR